MFIAHIKTPQGREVIQLEAESALDAYEKLKSCKQYPNTFAQQKVLQPSLRSKDWSVDVDILYIHQAEG